jgi:catechol 2,3-dioxygenase-like lactoylglutathione lyase family enzyme
VEHSKRLRSSVSLAIEAGDIAAAATRQIADGNRDPDDTDSGIRGLIARRSAMFSGPAVTRTQIDRTCEHLDEFVAALGDVNEQVASPDRQIDTSHDWAARLTESVGAAADIHNEVTATMAALGIYRANIVLGRSLVGSGDEADVIATASGRDAMPAVSTTWTTVCIDCDDADRLSDFYCRLLGWQVTASDGHGWVQARDPRGGVGLNFQSEPDYVPPVWPEQPGDQAKMLHFEIMVDDLERGVARAIESGATQAPWQPPDRNPARIRVMLDPAGHPFCLFTAGE